LGGRLVFDLQGLVLSDQPQRVFKQESEKYPKSPKIPDSYFDGAQWERVGFPTLGGFGGGLGGVSGMIGGSGSFSFGAGFGGGFGGGFSGFRDDWNRFGGGGSSGIPDFREHWPADLSTSPRNPKAGNSRN
jgi:hypothetical protein